MQFSEVIAITGFQRPRLVRQSPAGCGGVASTGFGYASVAEKLHHVQRRRRYAGHRSSIIRPGGVELQSGLVRSTRPDDATTTARPTFLRQREAVPLSASPPVVTDTFAVCEPIIHAGYSGKRPVSAGMPLLAALLFSIQFRSEVASIRPFRNCLLLRWHVPFQLKTTRWRHTASVKTDVWAPAERLACRVVGMLNLSYHCGLMAFPCDCHPICDVPAALYVASYCRSDSNFEDDPKPNPPSGKFSIMACSRDVGRVTHRCRKVINGRFFSDFQKDNGALIFIQRQTFGSHFGIRQIVPPLHIRCLFLPLLRQHYRTVVKVLCGDHSRFISSALILVVDSSLSKIGGIHFFGDNAEALAPAAVLWHRRTLVQFIDLKILRHGRFQQLWCVLVCRGLSCDINGMFVLVIWRFIMPVQRRLSAI